MTAILPSSTRRSFLQFLGVSPFAVNQAAAETAGLIGISPTGRLRSGRNSFSTPTTDQIAPELGNELLQANVRHYAEDVSKQLAIAEHFKSLLRSKSIPQYVHDELRRKAGVIHALDPDIASKRSWSFSVKMVTQRERNYTRLLAALHDDILGFEQRVSFWKRYGFNFWT